MKNSFKILSKQLISLKVIMVLFLATAASTAFGQSSYYLDPSSTMVINGTSTIHDWESDVTKITGQAQIALEGQKIESIDKLYITIPVASIKSGKGAMDDNTYEALKEEKYPEIKFQLKQIKTNQEGQIKALGDLTIAGVTNSVEMPVKYSVQSDAKIEFKGSFTFNMSEFKITPPTALMGTIKTGDQVTLNFETFFIKR